MRLTYSALALVVLADQMLLPMFHVGGLPFKPSYLILGLSLLPRLLELGNTPLERARHTKDWQVASAIGVVVFAGMVGEAWLSATQTGAVHGEAVRSALIYMLAILAFSLGQRASKFQFKWLLYVFFTAITLNFAFVILQASLPAWLTRIYYPTGFKGEIAIFEYLRPRGLFGNPNVSAHMVSICVLFIHLALRHRFLTVSSTLVGVAIVLLPVLLAAALASRGELVVNIVLGYLNAKVIFFGGLSSRARIQRILFAIGLGLVLVASAMHFARDRGITSQFVRVTSAVADAEARTSSRRGIARPLLTLADARERFVLSPVFGSGFGQADYYPFNVETIYYHNDWFRLLVTSGIIGLTAMIWFLWRFAWPLGWPVLIPLVLPGMVNTFMLNVPAFICYFLMIGVLRESIARRSRYGAERLSA